MAGSLDRRTLDRLVGVAHQVIAERRQRVTAAVDGDVLQLACSALQDLQEIQSAEPSDALQAAIDKLRTSVSTLRAMIDREVALDSELAVQIQHQLVQPLASDV